MKNIKLILLGGGLVIVLLAAVLLFGSSVEAPAGDNAAMIASDDGRFELSIPEGALPEGVSITDISITQMASDDLPFTSDADEFIATYQLQPHGLAFAEPVSFELSMSYTDQRLPEAFLVNETGKTVSPIENFSAIIDSDSGEAVLSGELDHFSYVTVRFGYSYVTLTDPSFDRVGGETFDATAKVTLIRHPLYRDVTDDLGEKISEAMEWKLKGAMEWQEKKVAPSLLENVPPQSTLALDTFTAKGTFNCVEEGRDRFVYKADITRTVFIEWYGRTVAGVFYDIFTTDKTNAGTYSYEFRGKWGFECLKSLAAPPASDTHTDSSSQKGEQEPEIETPNVGGKLEIRGGIFGD